MYGNPELLASAARHPFPVAVAVRGVMQARSPDQAFERLRSAAEHTAILLAAVSLAWARTTGLRTSAMREWAEKATRAGVSFGDWARFASQVARDAAADGRDLLGMTEMLSTKGRGMKALNEL